MNQSLYFYLFSKNQWMPSARVTGWDIDLVTQIPSPSIKNSTLLIIEDLTSLVRHHNAIQKSLLSQKLIETGTSEDNIYVFLLNVTSYRQCTLYYILQYSNKTNNLRLLVFGLPNLLEGSLAWGTGLTNINSNNIKLDIEDYLIHAFENDSLECHLRQNSLKERLFNVRYSEISNIIYQKLKNQDFIWFC